mgnify:CR=1 FL=1
MRQKKKPTPGYPNITPGYLDASFSPKSPFLLSSVEHIVINLGVRWI